MAVIARLAGIVLWLGICCWQGVCQTGPSDNPIQQPASEASVFESFFSEVAQRKNASWPTAPNGQSTGVKETTIQEAAGLTEREASILTEVAMDLEARMRSVNIGSAIFEARLRSVESGQSSEELERQLLRDMEERSRQMVMEHVQQLRTAFGDARFQTLYGYARARQKARTAVAAAAPRR